MNEAAAINAIRDSHPLDVLLAGLTSERLSHAGKWYHFEEVPMELRPVQKPYPPLWYGGGNEHGALVAARYGMNFVTLGGNDRAKSLIKRYAEMWVEAASDPLRAACPVDEPLIGLSRHIFVAETEGEAERRAERAYAHWYASLAKLWHDHGTNPVTGMIIDDYAVARRDGQAIVGTPENVRAALADQIAELGYNYLVCQLAWGDLGHDNEMRSLELFAAEVMPALSNL